MEGQPTSCFSAIFRYTLFQVMARFAWIDLAVSPHTHGRHHPLRWCDQVNGAVVDRVRGPLLLGRSFIWWIDQDRRWGRTVQATVTEFVATHIVTPANLAAAAGVASAADFVGAPLPCQSRSVEPPGSPCQYRKTTQSMLTSAPGWMRK